MTAVFALSITALMALACGGILWEAKSSAERRANTLLDSAARQIRYELGGDEERHVARDIVNETSAQLRGDNLALAVIDKAGRVVLKSQSRVPPWPRMPNDDWRVKTVPAGADTILIGLPWDQTERDLRHLAMVLLSLIAFVALAAAVGAWLLVGHTLRPIRQLSRQAQSASADSLSIYLTEPSQDAEVVELVATLNGMLERLADTAAAKGRFYAAASHELRTPLQALLGHLEIAQRGDKTAEDYRAKIDEATRQTRRLVSLVRDLLLLNQLDTAVSMPARETVDAADVCERTLKQFEPVIEQRGLRVSSNIGTESDLLAPPTHVEMLARNLIENAVTYAAPGGAVDITLLAAGNELRLEIFNECPPPPPETLDRLMEPFFRPDAARSPASGGNGLGLAICKAIAAANEWRLVLLPDPKGFRVVVTFPEAVERRGGAVADAAMTARK